jgi:hypothetical protein
MTITQAILDRQTVDALGGTVVATLALKAPLASPTLTGTPAAPTAAVGTNTTQLATTAFVRAEIAARVPQTLSADRGDASVTLVTGTDAPIQLFETELTANRTVTLSTTAAVNGSRFRIVRSGLGAFTLDVGGLLTIPSATAAWVDVAYNGSAWKLVGYGLLAAA